MPCCDLFLLTSDMAWNLRLKLGVTHDDASVFSKLVTPVIDFKSEELPKNETRLRTTKITSLLGPAE